MCTVTYVPTRAGVLLTSNRDEQHTRSLALPPRLHQAADGLQLLYPTDPDKGGTWIGCSNRSTHAILLNGAFEAHQHQPHFTHSRGLVLLSVLQATDPLIHFLQQPMDHTAPFTMILLNEAALYECIWDGNQKHHQLLNPQIPHIWSSVTLYDPVVRAQRVALFQQWLQQHPQPTVNDLMQFHEFGGEQLDEHNKLVMNRNNLQMTVSISNLHISQYLSTFRYYDLLQREMHINQLHLTKTGSAIQ